MAEKGERKYRWYALKVLSGKEEKLKTQIWQELEWEGMKDLVEDIVYPVEKIVRMRNNKRMVREKNMFPGYLFLKAVNVQDLEPVLRRITGVAGFVKVGKEILPLSPEDERRMFAKFNENLEEAVTPEVRFEVGETVKIVDGTFAGTIGTVEDINEERLKLLVSVEIFGRKIPIELNYLQVEKQ